MLIDTTPGMLKGGMGKPPIPSSPPVIFLSFKARTYMSWPKARWSMENAEPVTLTTMGHKISAKTTAANKPIPTAPKRDNPPICFKARAVP